MELILFYKTGAVHPNKVFPSVTEQQCQKLSIVVAFFEMVSIAFHISSYTSKIVGKIKVFYGKRPNLSRVKKE